MLKNLYDSLPAYLNQSVRLKEQFEKLGVKSDIMPNSPARIGLDGNGNIIHGYDGYDFSTKINTARICLKKAVCGFSTATTRYAPATIK